MTPGIDLAGAFYRHAVAPLLAGRPHAAALLGDGSEVLGYDDAVSTDHDFGPRVQVFVPTAADVPSAEAAMAGLPAEFGGHPVGFVDTDRPGVSHHVEVTTAARFFADRVGTDPAEGVGPVHWLLTPTQLLAGLTAGAVFHDPDGDLARRRDALRWYPDDVWRYALAAGWLRVDQVEPFVGRTGGTGDDLGSRVLAGRLTHDLMRLAFLVERRWAPYAKWFGRAFGELRLAPRIRPFLDAALSATRWRDRESALTRAASVLLAATNDLGLCEPVDPAPRRFHDRDIRVVGGARMTVALTAAITDPELVRLVDAMGRNVSTGAAHLPGTIDQVTDSIDVTAHAGALRAAAARWWQRGDR